jgi:predicted membrane protein
MKNEKYFWGILLVLTGAFLIISKLGYFPDVNAFSLVLTAFLVVIAVKSLLHLDFAGVLFPIAFICIIYDNQLGITNITPWTVLIAALFGSIGLSMIFHKQNRCIHIRHEHHNNKFEEIDVEDGSYVRFRNVFSGSIKYVNTNNFEQADFDCSFGSLKVYFDNAVMSNESAVLRLNASFSAIELYVPKSWRIENKTSLILGAIDEKNKNDQITTNTLTLTGDIKFSGVEIIYI